ncbi:hypothetical protein A3Q56_06475 [Intoshia linei]|uniref:Uncharacterized protein n=1 Tax=Intoshia linei TaxID=1819745 RepID=A0A177AVF0_9BILA|nr:hypothetical protein A3Q56_06475 [Intoshia linei]
MFIKVVHGTKEPLMVNVNCRIFDVLQFIFEKTNTEATNCYELDLADEYGLIKSMQDNVDYLLSDKLVEMSTYILLERKKLNELNRSDSIKSNILSRQIEARDSISNEDYTFKVSFKNIDLFPHFNLHFEVKENVIENGPSTLNVNSKSYPKSRNKFTHPKSKI